MKKIVIILLIVLALFLVACRATEQELGPVGSGANVTPSDNVTPSNDSSESSDPSESSQPNNSAELAALEELFKFGKEGWYNMALTSYYTTTTDVDISNFFYNGFADLPTDKPTDTEKELLKDMPGFDPEFDLIRLPADRMDAVLQQYFGAGLSQFDVSDLWYVESTNTYYLSHTDAVGFIELVFERMETAGDGTITIYYMADSMPGILKLKASGDGYRILSNQPA